jgi:type I restriction enzyme R subunit
LNKTVQGIGLTVKVADSISRLKELLPSTSSDLVMAMIHKFQERELQETFRELNASPKILILTDEAHRSQYALLGANLDRALPNATAIGCTGTPTDKTEKRYKDYIDKYTMRQSIGDRVTLEIVYEGRTHNAEVSDRPAMDREFADVFSDYTIAERLQILGYGSRDAYLEAEETVRAKARDMVDHYVHQVFPNGFKAQVVATSQEATVRYKAALDAALTEKIAALEANNPTLIDVERLKRLQTAVVISAGSHNDLPHIKAHTDPAQHRKHIASFKLPFDAEGEENGQKVRGDVGILIVTNMLLTGFDAPIEQVLYLDKVMRDHTLLQAIARVNRVASGAKEKGFVVDYVGIGHHLKEAIDAYDEREQKEIRDALASDAEQLDALAAAHRTLQYWVQSQGLHDLSDYDAFFDLFYDEDTRFTFMTHFKEFTSTLNVVFPKKEALEYLPDYNAFAEINVMAERHFRDARLSLKGIPQKLRAITDAHLRSRGIETKIAPISIFDTDFQAEVGKRRRSKTKAAEVEHAIRHEITVRGPEDPDLYASFAEAMEAILGDFKDNWDEIYKRLEELRQRILSQESEPTYGLHRRKQMPFFRTLRKAIFGDANLSDEQISQLVSLTQSVTNVLEQELPLTGFWSNIPARNQLRQRLQQEVLLSREFHTLPGMLQNYNALIARVMELAEKHHDTLVYAS